MSERDYMRAIMGPDAPLPYDLERPLLDRCADAVGAVHYLPVAQELRQAAEDAGEPKPTDEDVRKEWSRRQAQACLEAAGITVEAAP